MQFVWFSLWFTLIHMGAYILAGLLALRISQDLYSDEERLLDFITDMSESGESSRVQKLFLPAQLLRGVLMSLVLYPVVPLLGSISFGGDWCGTSNRCRPACNVQKVVTAQV